MVKDADGLVINAGNNAVFEVNNVLLFEDIDVFNLSESKMIIENKLFTCCTDCQFQQSVHFTRKL